ncbi:MAG: hypothetical protein QM770_02540 [Tepidisphaeraceae bacterium]
MKQADTARRALRKKPIDVALGIDGSGERLNVAAKKSARAIMPVAARVIGAAGLRIAGEMK